jgi:hypothetical protein
VVQINCEEPLEISHSSAEKNIETHLKDGSCVELILDGFNFRLL